MTTADQPHPRPFAAEEVHGGAEPDPPPDGSVDAAGGVPGLATLHAMLDRVVTARGLRALTIVVDDPELGLQAFRAGTGPFESGLAGVPGCRTEPPVASDDLDGALLVALCAASLRVEVLRGDDVEGADAAELALRRLPGVRAVVVERDADLLVVQVHAEQDAPTDLARTAARAAAPFAAATDAEHASLVVEIVRAGSGDALPRDPSAGVVAGVGVPEVVAVRSVPETGEIEVHIRRAETRTIGRAPMAQGLTGAVAATLDALHQVAPGLELGLAWVRTIETTADGRFVVAVALHGGAERAARHGLGSGASPIEAAARGALDAALRNEQGPV